MSKRPRRQIKTKADALDYFDALERAQGIARSASTRKSEEWSATASHDERLAMIDHALHAYGAEAAMDDPSAPARSCAGAFFEQNRREQAAMSDRYMHARWVMPRERVEQTRAPQARPTGSARRPRARMRRTRTLTRSSAASGDSGDGEPGEPEPPDVGAAASEGPLARLSRTIRRALRRRQHRCTSCGAHARDTYECAVLDINGGLCRPCAGKALS